MRLLRLKSDGSFEFTDDLENNKTPKYVILSHTWLADEEEVRFDELLKGNAHHKAAGFHKIKFCGEQAARDGLDSFWVDTCCINKTSSAEVQEAITSMFKWYRNATKCYVYLADVSVPEDVVIHKDPPHSWESDFRSSRWFTRGWTLQELIALASVEFFSAQGRRLGDKRTLEHYIHEITGIPHQALRGDSLGQFSVAERLSWAENRQTKRKEDKAYSLLGIFSIFMPLIVELLQDIKEWADGLDERCIFWLNGIAGTGKSTVARTIARTYHDRDNLGASFFFSRGGGDVGLAEKLFTTLAFQLAAKIPSVRRYICEAIMQHPDIELQSLRDQWDKLILDPLSKLDSISSPSTIVLVIDALDECDNERDIRILLRLLAQTSSLNNIRLRTFITSRPEIAIRCGFTQIPEAERQVFVLQDILPTIVDRDLSLFFEDSLKSIREERGFAADWPGSRIIKRLVEISCGLFIWASTACRYIREGKRMAKRRIDNLINNHRSREGPEKQLDEIYITVLKDSIQQGYNDEEKQEFYVNAIAFSPDGSLLASGSADQMVRLWDIAKGEIRLLLDGHSGRVNSVCFSPDGKQIVSGSDDMTIRVWDADTETECMVLRGHEKKVTAVTYSPDGRLIASGSDDKTVRLWVANTEILLSTLRAHTSGINAVASSPDGQLLASGSFNDEVRLWNAKTGESLGALDEFEENVIFGLPLDQRLTELGLDEKMDSLDHDSTSIANKESKGHSSTIICLAFPPDGQTVATGSHDATIKLWGRDATER
ncbi:hypothetical protein EG329_002351 [Mollisiaceae sp. DMI_Dod_QoI]|nr:hypothetical protein EG329_002351 [Helotiales sp. DMI_Dod_QoI]